jgi:hypothetical protein
VQHQQQVPMGELLDEHELLQHTVHRMTIFFTVELEERDKSREITQKNNSTRIHTVVINVID